MDPIVGSAVTKAMVSAGEQSAVESTKLMSRLLGPSFDVVGEAMARWTAQRVRNVGRIVELADEKASRADGEVPPRVAYKILEDGSLSEDEVMVEYLSGVLAGSRTPGGHDDRGIAWATSITTLSSLQLRGHFLLYREWAIGLRGREGMELTGEVGRQGATMHVDLGSFIEVLLEGSSVPGEAGLRHVVSGLERANLIGERYAYGGDRGPILEVYPSLPGLEMYGWAQGEADLAPHEFHLHASDFPGVEIPRPSPVLFPRLDNPPTPGLVVS